MNDTDQQQPTKEERKSLQELTALREELEANEALYGAALDGLSKGIDDNVRELDEYDIDEHMLAAEEDVAGMIADGLEDDVDEMERFEEELQDDDLDEEAAFQDDDTDPYERGQQLADEGEEE